MTQPILSERFQARLQRDSATAISLRPYKGNVVEVAEEKVVVPAAGLSRATTDNLITAAGADAAAAMAASTLYYVYVSNSKATFSPSTIRASATAPTTFNGIKYLGASGNALNWRFVGWVRTTSATEFADSLTQRLVINYYNRLRLSLRTVPGYVNDNANTSYTTTSTTWVRANAGTGSRIEFIANGEDAVTFSANAAVNAAAGAGASVGLNLDSTTDALTESESGNIVGLAVDVAASGTYHQIIAEGYHTSDLMIRVTSGAIASTYVADFARNGAAADPFGTYLEGTVMG